MFKMFKIFHLIRNRQMPRSRQIFTCFALLLIGCMLSTLIYSPINRMQNTSGRFFTWHNTTGTGNPKTMVVILTYMRSGSTLTGDIIQRSPDVFYVFEPLWSVSRLHEAAINTIHIDKRHSPKVYQSRDILEAFLTCNMQLVDVHTLRQGHHHTSPDTRSYHTCIKQQQGVLGAMNCLPLLEKPCRESRVSVVKTVRFDIGRLGALMKAHPGMKVIHLIRDPRATLRSLHTFGVFRWKDLSLNAKTHCKRVLKDIENSVVLQQMFPSRLATLRYEDLILRQEEVLRDLYSFIGLKLTDDIKDYVHNITSSGEWCPLCTSMNGTAMLHKWRRKLSFKHATLIDSRCGSVYKKLGYRPLTDESVLTNLSISLIDDFEQNE